MKKRRLQKFILSFGIVLSLFSSSFAACICSHHAPVKAENHAPSCHKTQESDAAETETENKFSSVSENCNCLVKISQPFVVGKSENVKAEKFLAVLPAQVKAENYKLISENETAKIHLEFYFYNSNYLKNLISPRAPPLT